MVTTGVMVLTYKYLVLLNRTPPLQRKFGWDVF